MEQIIGRNGKLHDFGIFRSSSYILKTPIQILPEAAEQGTGIWDDTLWFVFHTKSE